jgi:tetratricopeptide (TPR) repeat protein
MKRNGPDKGPPQSDLGFNSAQNANFDALLRSAREHHRTGRLAAAEKSYIQAIEAAPARAKEAHYRLGVIYAQTGRSDRAIDEFSAATRLDPNNAEIAAGLGNALLSANRLTDAIAAYRRALAMRPAFAAAHFNLANAMRQQGNLAEAVESYRRAISLAPSALHAYLNLAVTLQDLGNRAQAEEVLRNARGINPRSVEILYNLGIVLAAQGKVEDAMTAYRDALEIDSDIAAVHVNLGELLDERGQTDEAIHCYKRAIALDPALSVAHNNLALALAAQGHLDDAIAAQRNALALEPDAPWVNVNLAMLLTQKHERNDTDFRLLDEAMLCCGKAISRNASHIEAHRLLGVALRRHGDTDESFAAFMHHAELKYGAPSSAGGPRAPTRPYKLRHDLEQLDYLVEKKIVDIANASRHAAAASAETSPIEMSYELFHIEGGGRLATPAINPANNTARIETEWAESKPNIVVVDDFLTPNGLEELRRFCWGSTIWRQPYRNGYLGAFPDDGFACPLLPQLARELRDKYPGIIRDHILTGAWAFKYDGQLDGINAHADYAAVNVNFWITPDEANLDPDAGGLVLWNVPAPLDWDFQQYNQDEAAIYDFLDRANARSVTVPYRANRAVIFDSDLFHKTDRINFKDGYLNRRINVTFLYGYRHHGGHGA